MQLTTTQRTDAGNAGPIAFAGADGDAGWTPSTIRARIADLLADADVFDMDGLDPNTLTDDAAALRGAIITMVNHHDLTFTGLPYMECHPTTDEDGRTGSMLLLCLHFWTGEAATTYIDPKSLCPESPAATVQELLIEIAVALLDEATALSEQA